MGSVQNKNDQFFYEQALGDEQKYVKALANRYPGVIRFETGVGHILHDLVARLPSIPELDKQKTELCERIVEAVHPLAACLYAQSVCMTLTVTPETLLPPEVVEGLATYSAFDMQNKVMRHCFLAPPCDGGYVAALTIPAGLGVLCEPLHYNFQKFDDGTHSQAHTVESSVVWRWTDTAIRTWHAQRVENRNAVPGRVQLRCSALTESHVLGVVDTAAVAVLSAALMPTALGAGTKPDPHRFSRAFVHQAGLSETERKGASSQKPATAPEAAPKDAHDHLHPHATPNQPDVK